MTTPEIITLTLALLIITAFFSGKVIESYLQRKDNYRLQHRIKMTRKLQKWKDDEDANTQ